jgi:hypothetical protein
MAGLGGKVPAVGMSDEERRRMLSIHLDRTFHGTRAVAKELIGLVTV